MSLPEFIKRARLGIRVSNWLRASGAAEMFRDGGNVLFALPRRQGSALSP